MKKKLLTGVAAIVGSLMLSLSAFAAPATDIDDIGTSLPASSTTQEATQPPTAVPPAPTATPAGNTGSQNNTPGTIDYSAIGPNAEDIAQATEMVSPVVKWVNIGIGVVAALLGTFLIASTVIDLLYIVSPTFIRNLGNRNMQAQAGMGMGMGMGGMGAPAQAPQSTGFVSLISDDCRAALEESGVTGASNPANTMGGGMGMGMGGMGMGMGMGGMGMGGMGMGAPAGAAPMPKRAVVLCYLKKRVFTFILIGICAVLLTCTCFLDVGTKIGTWILNMVQGI